MRSHKILPFTLLLLLLLLLLLSTTLFFVSCAASHEGKEEQETKTVAHPRKRKIPPFSQGGSHAMNPKESIWVRDASAPYEHTDSAISDVMLDMAEIKPNKTIVFDLGSGDGRLLIEAIRRGAKKAVGLERRFDLVQESRQNAQEFLQDLRQEQYEASKGKSSSSSSSSSSLPSLSSNSLTKSSSSSAYLSLLNSQASAIEIMNRDILNFNFSAYLEIIGAFAECRKINQERKNEGEKKKKKKQKEHQESAAAGGKRDGEDEQEKEQKEDADDAVEDDEVPDVAVVMYLNVPIVQKLGPILFNLLPHNSRIVSHDYAFATSDYPEPFFIETSRMYKKRINDDTETLVVQYRVNATSKNVQIATTEPENEEQEQSERFSFPMSIPAKRPYASLRRLKNTRVTYHRHVRLPKSFSERIRKGHPPIWVLFAMVESRGYISTLFLVPSKNIRWREIPLFEFRVRAALPSLASEEDEKEEAKEEEEEEEEGEEAQIFMNWTKRHEVKIPANFTPPPLNSTTNNDDDINDKDSKEPRPNLFYPLTSIAKAPQEFIVDVRLCNEAEKAAWLAELAEQEEARLTPGRYKMRKMQEKFDKKRKLKQEQERKEKLEQEEQQKKLEEQKAGFDKQEEKEEKGSSKADFDL